MSSARAPRTPPTIAPTGGDIDFDEPEPLVPFGAELPVVVAVPGVGVLLETNTVVVPGVAPGTLSSMRSIVSCELPAGVPRGSAMF